MVLHAGDRARSQLLLVCFLFFSLLHATTQSPGLVTLRSVQLYNMGLQVQQKLSNIADVLHSWQGVQLHSFEARHRLSFTALFLKHSVICYVHSSRQARKASKAWSQR